MILPFPVQLHLRRLFTGEPWHVSTAIGLSGGLIVRTSRPLTVQEEKRVRSAYRISAIIIDTL